MSRVQIQTTIDAPPHAVWRRLADIADHVSWMADAAAIRFTGERRSGVGTTFECDTRVGPLRTTDVMEVTEWRERRAMGVRHGGLVTGTGRFVLRRRGPGPHPADLGRDLRFPWWLGGALGGLGAAPSWGGVAGQPAAVRRRGDRASCRGCPGTVGSATGYTTSRQPANSAPAMARGHQRQRRPGGAGAPTPTGSAAHRARDQAAEVAADGDAGDGEGEERG